MGRRMETVAPDWGADYNRNKLTSVKSMVFCNLWWTNRLANADPNLLGLYPLHLSIFTRDGRTTVSWPRLSTMAEGSPGLETVQALDQELLEIVRRAVTPDKLHRHLALRLG